MAFKICDPADLIPGRIFSEEKFLQAVKDYDWEKYRDRLVLVRGCGSTVIPPWAFMLITGKLSELARTVRYGNEHDNIVVYRSKLKDRNKATILRAKVEA